MSNVACRRDSSPMRSIRFRRFCSPCTSMGTSSVHAINPFASKDSSPRYTSSSLLKGQSGRHSNRAANSRAVSSPLQASSRVASWSEIVNELPPGKNTVRCSMTRNGIWRGASHGLSSSFWARIAAKVSMPHDSRNTQRESIKAVPGLTARASPSGASVAQPTGPKKPIESFLTQ